MTVHIDENAQAATRRIAGIRFFEIGKLYHFSCEHLPTLRVGDQVIVETARGRQLGQVMNLLASIDEEAARDCKPVLRLATPTDLMSQQLWKAREVEALITCREKANELGGLGDAKFVAAQYNFDGSLLTFLFSAEDKLNTTKLRTVLQRSFRAKIELRQIGPRDVAKLLGGMGACGIPRCCSSFLTDFSPISIKMAKAQGISLNPTEITGMCGRLRCCLIYEYEQYVEARQILPKRNKRVGTPHGEGKVIDVYPLRDAVQVLVEDVTHVVQREDLIPMEEWEAFQAKSQAGCSKHEDGACDCGARTSRAPEASVELEIEVEAEDLEDVVELPTSSVGDDQRPPKPDEPEQRSSHRKRPPRSRRGRHSQRGKGPDSDKGSQNTHE